MKKTLKITCIIILFINGIGALWGGGGLIYDPSGTFMQMPLSFLEHTPFINYLIPGIILFIVNGLFSIFILLLIFRNHPLHMHFIIIQGILLAGWISVQIALIQIFYPPLHLPFLLMGVFLLFAGIILKKEYLKIISA
jgi:hypothetical protein